jgi:competence ComEA-like helix-hairpin-helix protein
MRLRRRDQLVLAAAALVFCHLFAMFLFWQGWHRGELLDIEQVDNPRVASERIEFKLDINQAHWPELALLPGIGELRARRIVEHRESSGPYRVADELILVNGIGPKTLARIRPFLLPCSEP